VNVLHVIPSLSGGGAERFVADLVRHELRFGVDARMCVFRKGHTDLLWCKDLPQPSELEFHPTSGVRGRLELAKLVIQLREVIRREHPDILHTHLWPACRIVVRATRGLSLRHVWHVHDTQDWLVEKSLSARIRRVQMRVMIRKRNPFLIAVSAAERQMAICGLRLGEAEIATVLNGVDTSIFFPTEPSGEHQSGPVKLIMTAAFRPMKGHACLIEALSLLRKADVKYSVTLAGDLDTKTGQVIQERTRALGLHEVVDFAGHFTHMPKLLRSHDIFVLPSVDTEGLPLAMLEAMACGLPVVVSKVGGMPEVVENGVTGFVVEPGNSIELAQRLRLLIESPAMRREMGRRGSEIAAREYSFKPCAARILAIYRQILGIMP